MKIKKDCIETLNSTRIVCKEHKRKITFINSLKVKVSKIKVDGCQIIEGKRCDYLITYKNNEHFIELKGSDIRHAFKQLKRTIKILGNTKCISRVSYIISSRSPCSSPEIQDFRVKFGKKYNSKLVVKNNSFEVEI